MKKIGAIIIAMFLASPAMALETGCGQDLEYIDDLVYHEEVTPLDGVFDAGAPDSHEVVRSKENGKDYVVFFSDVDICIFDMKKD